MLVVWPLVVWALVVLMLADMVPPCGRSFQEVANRRREKVISL
jgi:hypothetical protein